MKRETILISSLLMGLMAPACSSSSNEGGNGGAVGSGGIVGSGGSSGSVCNGTSLVAAEANNYSFSSTLTFPPISVAPNSELSFDWGGVTTDFIGHDIDARNDLTLVSVLMWALPLADLQTALNSDNVPQSALKGVPLTAYPDGSSTSAKLFSFTSSGTPVASTDILPYFDATTYPPADYTYIFTAATGTIVGQNIKMIQSFLLDPNSTNTTVTMTSDSTKLSYKADLHSLTPTRIPVNQSAITLDWGQMKTNAMGRTFIPTKITKAMVAHYTETPTELEAKFLDIELISTAMYSGTIGTGTTVDFSSLVDTSGNAFSGIDSSGTWIVALQCTSCRNPAPLYLSVLKPCS